MIPSIKTDFPNPPEEPIEADASLRALSNREAEAARERQQAVRMESMVHTAQQAILAQTLAAPTPVASRRYKALRSKLHEQLAASAQEAQRSARAALSDDQRAALDRANALKTARMHKLGATAEADDSLEAGESAPKPEATEADVRAMTSAILSDLLAAETPVATAKGTRWRKATQQRLIPTQGTLKEESRLGGRRTGDRLRLEEESDGGPGTGPPVGPPFGTQERSCRPRVE